MCRFPKKTLGVMRLAPWQCGTAELQYDWELHWQRQSPAALHCHIYMRICLRRQCTSQSPLSKVLDRLLWSSWDNRLTRGMQGLQPCSPELHESLL